jgi:glucosamine--fructose-6-phosphate aminotransferase (isomerizing)
MHTTAVAARGRRSVDSARMDADHFLQDLEAKPAALRALADAMGESRPWTAVRRSAQRIVFLGMGSSRYAAAVAAARLRAHGIDAVSEYASAERAHPGGAGTVAIGISASGRTAETAEALRRHRDAGSAVLAVTNVPGSAIAAVGAPVVDLMAGREQGGIGCRTYQHTIALLLALEDRLADRDGDTVVGVIRRSADATEDLLARRHTWLADTAELVAGTGQVFTIAPHERLCSAEQGALVLRQGPRVAADAAETGEWLHAGVYLTKRLDYRALVFVGSRFDDEVMGWMQTRGSTAVTVGAESEAAAASIRFAGDDDPDVRLLTETLVPELIAAHVWRRQDS